MTVRHVFQGWLLSLLMVGSLARADAVTWVGTEFPPMAISQGPYAQQGYMDALFRHLQQTLPQHSFRQETVPWPRAITMAQSGGPYCLMGAAQTPEREAFLRFTAPYGYVYPIGVVIRTQDQHLFRAYLNKDGELRLDEMLQMGKRRIGIAGSRSYGSKIDALLRSLLQSNGGQVHQAHQDASTRSLISMLQNRRFDFMLAYPGEAVFYGGDERTLRFYPIAGNSELLAARFSCTKSPQTDRVFADLSGLIPALRGNTSFLNSYERWLPPDLVKSYRQRLARQLAATP